MMTPEETRKHNDAILSKLDLDTQLAAYAANELTSGRRGNLFIELACLMLFLRRTADRTFSREWILEHIGKPDMQHGDADTTELQYRLSFPDCDCPSEHWAALRLTLGKLTSLETWERNSQPQPAP